MSVSKRLWKRPWVVPLGIAVVVGVVGWWAQSTVEGALKAQLRSDLTTLLDAEVAAVRFWLGTEHDKAVRVAGSPAVRAEVERVLGVAADPARGPDAVVGSPQLRALLATMGRLVNDPTVAGYAVLDPFGRVVASPNQKVIGSHIGVSVAKPFDRVVAGATEVFGPLEYPTAESDPADPVMRPAMFVASPVRDQNDRVIAVFGMRFDPAQGFSNILQLARSRESGETYAFNADGVMITESRFADQLYRIGLLDSISTSSILNVQIRNPGANLLDRAGTGLAQAALPLTRMAAEAVSGHDGVDVGGYRNYRGVPVVGAWRWLDDYHFGVATEVDVREAYQTLYVVRQVFWALVGLLMFSAVGAFFYNFLFQDLSSRVRKAERLGQYTLEEKIGEGGMGSVYKARHAMLRRPTAVKLIKEGQVKQETLRRFEREVQLTSQLTNPSTVAIYDYGRTPAGVFYYAMEYLPGITLENLVMNDGPQPERRVIHILRQVSSSLAEAHAQGMIHRDIKPANIMVLERGGMYDVVKVLDFGLVKELENGDERVTAVNTVPGTPHFLAPEAIKAPDGIDARSDIYAVGAVGYFLLTGTFLFSGNSAIEVLGKQVHDAPVPPSQRLGRPIDPYLEKVILQCLAKDPDDRPHDAGELLEALGSGYQSPIGVWTQREAAEWWASAASQCESPECLESGSMEPTMDVDIQSRIPLTVT